MAAAAPNSPETNGNQTVSDNLIRRLSVRYFAFLAAVATLVMVDQALIQPLLVRMNSFAPAINLAGRQRMLSQKLTKAALAMKLSVDTAQGRHFQAELKAALSEWTIAHSALRGGSEGSALPNLDSPEFRQTWAELQPHFEAMFAAGNLLADDRDPTASANAVSTIVEHEEAYLLAMERIVALLQQKADRQVALLRGIALSIAVALIVLLLVMGWYVVRPATRAIRGQVERLESQVAFRTRQLALINDSLRREILVRQEAEIRTRMLAAQLSHSARVSTMGHFAAALAHEINQPLAAIVNYAETCELDLAGTSQSSVDKLRQQIEHIRQTALRAGQIVRRIRNFVRPHLDTPPVEADLNALVADVVEFCRYEAQQAEVQIILVPSENKVMVSVDPIQIQQVLVNLMQNAFQAMIACPPPRRRMQITTSLSGGHVLISVRDSGPGISIDHESLFAPFSTTKTDGLGIGLSICRTIVENHHGQIRVEASDASGTSICLSLPLLQDHDAGQSKIADCVCR
jgi:two-component system, LuxR family, sensor kinase FixL